MINNMNASEGQGREKVGLIDDIFCCVTRHVRLVLNTAWKVLLT